MIRPTATAQLSLPAVILPLALAFGGLGACGGHPAGDPPLANRDPAPAAGGVRAIDWRNRAYVLTGLGAVTVKGGHAEFALDDDGKVSATGATSASFRVEPPLFADIDGDGIEDAVISSVLGTGGTGQFSSVAVYTLRGGRVVSLGDIPGGDRGDGGIRRIALERSETGGGDPDGLAGGAGGRAARGIERSETGGGDPDGLAGGAGGRAARGIERSETGGGDPDGSAGRARGRAAHGIDGNAVIVERNVLAEGDGACCASTWRRERWIWRGGALVEDPAGRGPLQPVP